MGVIVSVLDALTIRAAFVGMILRAGRRCDRHRVVLRLSMALEAGLVYRSIAAY